VTGTTATVSVHATYGSFLPPVLPPWRVTDRQANRAARPDASDERLPHSDVFFTCEDIEKAHAELAARGVAFPVPPEKQHWGWWSLFADPDGTRYALSQG
jgi:hypothetical protein